MIELRWLKRMPVIDEKSIFIANHVLQYRESGLQSSLTDKTVELSLTGWSEWKDVPTVEEE